VGQQFALVLEDFGKIHLDPAQRGRQRHPVGPRVEARRQIHYGIQAARHFVGNHPIEQDGSDDERPVAPGDIGGGLDDALAAFAGNACLLAGY
jgi:hypothetical protein